MNKLLKIVSIIIAILLIVIVGGYFAIKTYLTPETIRTIAERVASEAVQHPVEIGRVSLKIGFKIGITIDDVVITEAQGSTQDPMVQVDRIALNLRLLPLLRRQIEIGSVDFSGMKINLERNREGVLNIVPVIPRETKGIGWALSLTSISIFDGDLHYYDAKSKTELRIEDMRQDIAFRGNMITTGGTNMLHILKIKDLPEMKIKINNSIDYDTSKKQTHIKKLILLYQPIHLEVTGIIAKMETLNLDAHLKVDDMSKLQPLIPSASRPHILIGALKTKLSISGTTKEPNVVGECELRDVAFVPKGMRQGIENITGSLLFDKNAIKDISLRGNIGNAKLIINGSLQNLKDPMLNLTAQMDGDLHDLESITDDMRGIQMKGALFAKVSVKGKLKNVSYSGEYNLKEASIHGIGLAKPITRLNIKGTIKDDEAKIERCSGQLGRSDFSLSGNVSNFKKPVVQITNRSDLIDLDELIPRPEKDRKQEGRPMPLTLRGDVHINTLTGMDMVFKNVKTHFVYENGIIDLKDCVADAFDGKVKFDFYYNANRPEPYRISTRMTSVSAKQILKRFLRFDNLEGRLTGMGNFRGSGLTQKDVISNLSASGNLKVQNGIFKNFQFLTALLAWLGMKDYKNVELDDLAMYFSIDNGKANVKDWALSSRVGDFLTNGTVGLDGGLNLDITTTLSKQHSDIVKKYHGDWLFPIDEKGRATIDIIASGKLNSPQFRLDRDRINKRLKGKLKDQFEEKKKELENKLKDLFKGP